MNTQEIITYLESQSSEKNREGMARFGINTEKALGISVTFLRKFAKPYRNNHALALELWETGIHEAQILATIIEDPTQITEKQMDDWIKDFDSWDVCDQACTGAFDKTPFAAKKALEWSSREKEFEKRAGFALMAGIAWHSKHAEDSVFLPFLEAIKREAHDERNFVKKAVNWALRGIGKRNKFLHEKAMKTAEEIAKSDSKSSRWIASDALRELKTKQF